MIKINGHEIVITRAVFDSERFSEEEACDIYDYKNNLTGCGGVVIEFLGEYEE